MNKVLKDNRGYMLVEIIVASVIAFVMAYFLIDITLKLVNKNNDYYLDSVLSMDKNIVTKEIMDDINSKKLVSVDCSVGVNTCLLTYDDDTSKELKVENDIIIYGNYRKKLNDKLNVSDIVIENNNNILSLSIPAYTNYSKEDYGVRVVVSYSADIEVIYPNVNYDELTKEYSYSSSAQTYTVSKSGTYKLEVWGAQGGSYYSDYIGGKGGYISGTIDLEEGDILTIQTGGQDGTNGGGSSSCENGGGATTISLNGTTLITGAGGGAASNEDYGGAGGNGSGSGENNGTNGGGGASRCYSSGESYECNCETVTNDTCINMGWECSKFTLKDLDCSARYEENCTENCSCSVACPSESYIFTSGISSISEWTTTDGGLFEGTGYGPGEQWSFADQGYYYNTYGGHNCLVYDEDEVCETCYDEISSRIGYGGTSSVGANVVKIEKSDGINEGNGRAMISFVP